MGITALGQRKKILRAIQELKNTKSVVSRKPKVPSASSKLQATLQPGPPTPIRLAGSTNNCHHAGPDLLDGEYDEEASRASFAEALEEWRSRQKSGNIKEEVITLTNSQTETPVASNLGRHLACWQCYKCFPASQEVVGENRRSFCSEQCAATQATASRRSRPSTTEETTLEAQRLWHLDISY